MGSSNSVCISIHLDRTNPFFFDGELVSGTVNINIKDRVVKVNEVFVILTGETGYTTTHTDQNSNGSSSTQTDYHNIPFLNIKALLAIPEAGQREFVYHPGDYSRRFEMLLPNQLPPPLNQPHLYPHVRYYVRFVMDKVWYKRNNSQTFYLTVFPRLNLMSNPQWLTSTIVSNHNRKDVMLKGNLDKIGYVPGETITGLLEIDNPQRILIKKIQLTLTQHNRIECTTRYETIFETFLPTIDRRNDQQIIERFSMILPFTPLAPSYDFNGGCDRTAHVNVNYCLEFDVQAEGFFTNFKVSIPIIIGTEPGTNAN